MRKVFLAALCLLLSAGAYAQGCSTCTATAANLDAGSAAGLNNGIVYLALLPLVFMIVVGLVWYRKMKRAA